jgi:hypothetical protein
MDRDEQLAAYVDGELQGQALAAFERTLAADPELRAAAAVQRALRIRLAAAYDPVLDEPIPPSLAVPARAANANTWRPRLARGAALAACLALGVMLGRATLGERPPLESRGGVLVAGGPIEAALSRNLAAEPGPVRVGISFRTADGRYCRTFESRPDHLAGLACRQRQGWAAQVAARWDPAAATAYRTAGSETPAPVLAAVDSLIAGPPLDAAAERAARDRGWTR